MTDSQTTLFVTIEASSPHDAAERLLAAFEMLLFPLDQEFFERE